MFNKKVQKKYVLLLKQVTNFILLLEQFYNCVLFSSVFRKSRGGIQQIFLATGYLTFTPVAGGGRGHMLPSSRFFFLRVT